MVKLFGAIDLGASSGRVIAGIIGDGRLELTEIHRFANVPVQEGNRIFWDFAALQHQISVGIGMLAEHAAGLGLEVTSLGIDTWAVDYGLLDADGNLLARPRMYRDERNPVAAAQVAEILPFEEQYVRNGLQFLPFNTLYQLWANRHQDADQWESAQTMLLIPDLLGHWLTGEIFTERTNASTTGLLSVTSHEWDWQLIDQLGFKRSLFTRLVDSGEVIGKLLAQHASHPALANTVVTIVPSHDTAAAVVGSPLSSQNSAYLSSGTWSLVGLELPEPVITQAARAANFTNELGAHRRTRLLKNLSGLWLLQQSLQEWQQTDPSVTLTQVLADAARVKSEARIDVNDPRFVSPGQMPQKIQAACRDLGFEAPQSRGEIVRCIIDSLADAYAAAIAELEAITGIRVEQLNVVGGGSQNQLLARLTANAAGIPVLTGPVEATALGNLISQASAHGVAPTDIAGQRALIQQHFSPSLFTPGQ